MFHIYYLLARLLAQRIQHSLERVVNSCLKVVQQRGCWHGERMQDEMGGCSPDLGVHNEPSMLPQATTKCYCWICYILAHYMYPASSTDKRIQGLYLFFYCFYYFGEGNSTILYIQQELDFVSSDHLMTGFPFHCIPI